MKKLHYNYLKPPFYFLHLLIFFIVFSSILTFQLIFFTALEFRDFHVVMISLLLLLLCIGVIVEYFKRGEYMSPLEIYDIVGFVKEIMHAKKNNEDLEKFFLSYVKKPKEKIGKLKSKKRFFVISTISKIDNYYEVILIDEAKVVEYFFIKFFLKDVTLKLRVKKVKGEFKIVSIY